MAYTVNKSNPLAAPNQFTVQDNVLNIQTDLTFVGKGYEGYGEVVAENFLHLLENFSNTEPPSKPIKGQLWFDETTGKLKVYAGTAFQPAGGATYAATAPDGALPGDLWVDSTTQQLYFNNGSTNILVGPPSSNDSGLVFETILDSADNERVLIRMKSDGETVAIISEDEFTPKIEIEGFVGGTIKPGFNLYGAAASGSSTSYKFVGTATDADKLGGIEANNYVTKSSSTANVMTSQLIIENEAGLSVGANRDFAFTAAGDSGAIVNRQNNQDILFRTTDSGVLTTVMMIDGSESRVGIGTSTPTTKLQVVGTVKSTLFDGDLEGNISTSDIYVSTSGTIRWEGTADNDYEITLQADNPTADRTIRLPNASGTLLTDQTTNKITGGMMKSRVSLEIRDSAGSVIKTIYGPGEV